MAPRADHVQALLGLTTRTQILRMHIEAKGAAVELRDAIIDKVDQLWCETRPLDGLAQRHHGLAGVRIRLGVLDALLHRNLHSAPRILEATQATFARS